MLLLAIVLMAVDHRLGRVENLRGTLSVVVYPLQYVVNLPIEFGRWIKESLVTRQALIDENARLRHQNFLLKSRSQKFASLESENMRLRELLESSLERGERVLVADVLAVELEPSTRQMVLNKGTQQGVYVGQPIVDADGIVGQVIHVNPFSCTGLLITDSSHALPVQINRSGLRAIANGTGTPNGLELAYVPINGDVKSGDLIVSSGMDGRFPAGYPVGSITGVAVDPGEPFAKITAIASAQSHQAREVLLVWPEPKPGTIGGGPSASAAGLALR